MSESTPLLKHQDEEAQGEDAFEDGWLLSPQMRYTLYGIGGAFSLAVLWFFVIFLPAAFIPRAQTLDSLVKIQSLDIELVPVTLAPPLDEKYPGSDKDEIDFRSSKHVRPVKPVKPKQVDKLIMIGDIHGNYKELRKLLKKANYNPHKDRLLVLGDFITKGPDSLEVLNYLVDNDIDCILGNHELYVLKYYSMFHRLKFPEFVNHPEDALLTTSGLQDDPEFILAKKLQPHHVKYINKCSVIKQLGPVPVYKKKFANNIFKGISTLKTTQGIAVHAGLRWDLTLEQQDPNENLEMRSLIGPFFNESTSDPSDELAVSWSKIWNMKQKELPLKDTKSVYYGHDARRGLMIKKFSKGMDTGCYSGRELAAIVIWNEQSANGVTHHERVVQVKC